jgi:prepilin-type N-terminal cleavage/methylation domain-containing protein
VNEDGYTLLEVLVALAMLSLAVTGFSRALEVLAKWQRATEATTVATAQPRRAQVLMERAIDTLGPFRSDHPEGFSGDARGFRFACGGASACSMHVSTDGSGAVAVGVTGADGSSRLLPLGEAGPAHFVYRGSETVADTWPPASGGLQVLRSISLVGQGSEAWRPILVARLWKEQPADCLFDAVMQDCR